MSSGRWEGSDRKGRLPAGWNALRELVLARASNRCQAIKRSTGKRCTNRANQVDHIVAGDDHSLGNLQALCIFHHREKSALEGVEARQKKWETGRRGPEDHPGRR